MKNRPILFSYCNNGRIHTLMWSKRVFAERNYVRMCMEAFFLFVLFHIFFVAFHFTFYIFGMERNTSVQTNDPKKKKTRMINGYMCVHKLNGI